MLLYSKVSFPGFETVYAYVSYIRTLPVAAIAAIRAGATNV